jgi:hypothetical protein
MREWIVRTVLPAMLVGAIGSGAVAAQQQRASPHETAKATVEGATITVDYGRPSMRGRKIMGELVPFGKVWRTGADEATTLTTDRDIRLGDLDVPAGKYTLYTIPGEQQWQVIVSRQTGQWGTQYDPKQDLGRTTAKVTKRDTPVEQFTISVDQGRSTAAGAPQMAGGVLRMAWETTEVSVPISVKK